MLIFWLQKDNIKKKVSKWSPLLSCLLLSQIVIFIWKYKNQEKNWHPAK